MNKRFWFNSIKANKMFYSYTIKIFIGCIYIKILHQDIKIKQD